MDPFSRCRDAFQLNEVKLLRTLSSSSDRKGFKKGTTAAIFDDNSYTSIANATMVFRVTQNVCQEPTLSCRKSGPSGGTSGKSPLFDSTKLPKTSGLDNLRESLQAEGIPKGLQSLLQNPEN